MRDVTRAVWLYLAKQHTRVTARQIGESLGVRPSDVLPRMMRLKHISGISNGQLCGYAVTPSCHVPRGISLSDILAAMAPGAVPDENPTAYRYYSPLPGSVPWRLCKYFENHPEAVLSRKDIADLLQLDVRSGIAGNIARAVSNGAIREIREEGKEIRWGKGPSDNVMLRDEVPIEAKADECMVNDGPRANDPFRLAGLERVE